MCIICLSVSFRPKRCTGLALSVAIALVESCWLNLPSRILLFSGGVCTTGPGQVGSSIGLLLLRCQVHLEWASCCSAAREISAH